MQLYAYFLYPSTFNINLVNRRASKPGQTAEVFCQSHIAVGSEERQLEVPSVLRAFFNVCSL